MVVFGVGQVVETEVGSCIFRQQKFFGCTDLVEKLGQFLEVGENSGHSVAFDGCVLIGAVGKHFYHAGWILLNHFDWLFPVMNIAHTSVIELTFEAGFLCTHQLMRQLKVFVFSSTNFIPDKSKYIFRAALDRPKNVLHGLLRLKTLLMRIIQYLGQTLELFMLQKLDVHHIDQSAAVFQLFRGLIKLRRQVLKCAITEMLIDCLKES